MPDQPKAEPTEAILVDPWKDHLYVARRRPLLHLDVDVVIIGLDPEMDETGVGDHACMAHRVVHQFADGDPGSSDRPLSAGGGIASSKAARASRRRCGAPANHFSA